MCGLLSLIIAVPLRNPSLSGLSNPLVAYQD